MMYKIMIQKPGNMKQLYTTVQTEAEAYQRYKVCYEIFSDTHFVWIERTD